MYRPFTAPGSLELLRDVVVVSTLLHYPAVKDAYRRSAAVKDSQQRRSGRTAFGSRVKHTKSRLRRIAGKAERPRVRSDASAASVSVGVQYRTRQRRGRIHQTLQWDAAVAQRPKSFSDS